MRRSREERVQVKVIISCFRDLNWEKRFIRALNHTAFEGVTVRAKF